MVPLTSSERIDAAHRGLTLFCFKALLWESIILLLPPHLQGLYYAILLRDYCAIYDPLPGRFVCMPHCMRLASSGVGGVRRVRLTFGRHPMHPPPTRDDAGRIQNIHKTPTQLPTYNDASRTRRTPPTPDDASRMQYSHKTRATSPLALAP